MYSPGELQPEKAAPSSAHSKSSSSGGVRLSLPRNATVAVSSGVEDSGPAVISVSGRVTSGPSTAVHS